MAPRCYLVREEHVPEKARFPVVDAHNHLWGAWDGIDRVVTAMDSVGVVCYADLTANLHIEWAKGGYRFHPADIAPFLAEVVGRHPGRFFGFTTATFNRPVDKPLYDDAGAFVEETVSVLRDHVSRGLRGLKILKELGLHYRNGKGQLIRADDKSLAPIWEEAGKLGIPVLIHQADPYGFFEPVTPENEHYDTMLRYPSWSFADPKYPRFKELLERCRNLVRAHPRTTFLLPHVANYPEDLGYVGRLLDESANVFIDFSARLDELGRQPYTAREFFIRYQDRIFFGSDMPASVEMYRCYFRFLETRDECFEYPDYEGRFGHSRWPINGIGLPDSVLEKIYHLNAIKLIPGLKDLLKGRV